jgi:hypothetical protein
MRIATTLEAELRQDLRGSMSTGAEEDELSTGRIWAAGFHQVRSVLAWRAFLNLRTLYFFNFEIFSGRSELRILNQWLRGHACTSGFPCHYHSIKVPY